MSLPTIKFKKKTDWKEVNERRRAYWRKNKLCLRCGGPRPCGCYRRKGRQLRYGEICLDCLGVGFHRGECVRKRFPVDR